MKDFRPRSFLTVSNPNPTICHRCRKSLAPKFRRWKIDDVKCLSLYEYNDGMRSLIYQFKGCGDYELRTVLVENVRFWAKLRFSHYIVVPAPSWPKHDKERGFNHVYSIFEQLGLPMAQALYKKSDWKQSDQSASGRKEVYKVIGIRDGKNIKGKNVLLVDDVFTTGSTIKACLALIQKEKPRKVFVLLIAKTMPSRKRE